MRLPIVSRGSLDATEQALAEMRAINAALQERFDALLASYMNLKQAGYQEVRTFAEDERFLTVSIEDADREAALAETDDEETIH